MFCLRLLFFIAFLAASTTVAGARQLAFDDLRGLELPTDAQISPDGRTIAATFMRYDFDGNGRPQSLVLIDVQSSRQTVVAAKFKSATTPRWSPDGKTLAFLAGDAKGVFQVFAANADGANVHQITHAAEDVQALCWSQDGTRIAFTALVSYKPLWLAKYGDAFEASDTSQTATSASEPAQLFVGAADGTQPKQLTFGKASVTNLAGWRGNRVIIGRAPDADTAHVWQTRVDSFDATTGASTTLVAAGLHNAVASYNTDGGLFAYSGSETASPLSEQGLFIQNGHSKRELTYSLDRNIQWAAWLPKTETLLAGANDRTRIALWTIDTSGTIRPVRVGSIDVTAPASVNQRGEIALIGSTPSDFGNVYYLASAVSAPRQITHFNPSLASVSMGRTQPFSWRGPNGFTEYGVVTYPPNYSSANRYPLVVLPVGGPGEAMNEGLDAGPEYHEGLADGWTRQMLAQHGDIVFEPNYRGCDNAGRRYLMATVNDILIGPGADIMAGVRALARRASIDPSRMAITGHSEGGLFTAYLAAAYHVWKAGVAVDGDYDLNDEYNYGQDSSGNQKGYATYLLGSPWTDAPKTFARNSPITYAGSVRTNLLLLHFTGDPEVPVTEGYKERRALLDHGIPVTMVLIPGTEHFPSDPVHQREALQLWFDWLNEHL